ncbi:protein CURLY FLAG LEAF 1-like [Vicia villosa]|uniref:protein CURLY FLAG LEAF 1-like n=1 Tax=Vicia villosa TaxID=3911 RepID=UPI00273C2D7C|nr:protein CURLY FLAG LEAF 1-like [Vicia villosa]XP_058739188.1 protein CURLY FLAG LEAF 1-like [Vicia villosa]
MEAITASLERSLQNCSLNNNNHHQPNGRTEDEGSATTDAAAEGGGRRSIGISSSTSEDNNNHITNNSDTTLELNSHISLPYHWEQCLDLKTGEIYYLNWRNGMKAKEDPRRVEEEEESEEEEEEEEEEESWYDDSEECSSECSTNEREVGEKEKENVLVVAGCKSCLMYFMVPKQVEDCPKCNGQLLHFDRSENCSP